MTTISLSNASTREINETLAKWRKRRKLYLLLSLLIIPAPITMSFALFTHNNIVYFESGGRHNTNIVVAMVFAILGAGFPIVIVPVLRYVRFLGQPVLGTRIIG
jgi:hypothetical protein